jgi:death-on-curing protein
MKYVNKKMVLVINRMCFELSGGAATDGHNIRAGQGLGFVDRIFENSIFGMELYPDIYHQAAAYMFQIIKNHTFIDGNKRTGLATAITFLALNNICFKPFDEDQVFDYVISVAEGEKDPDIVIPEIAVWLKSLCREQENQKCIQ